MHPIDADNCRDYLCATGRIAASTPALVRELGGGVSNIVLRIDVPDRPPFVLKQVRGKLRVAMDWYAPLDRIWAEVAALEVLQPLLPPGRVPKVLYVDRPNYLFAMSCAPDGAVAWKAQLMAGRADPAIAREAGRLLAVVHARSVGHPALATTLADGTCFDELRVDPYYRTIARAHPDLAPTIDDLIASMPCAEPEPALVLGDYSPKNILVDPTGALMLLDFECAHAGDPAFDLGFALSHFILKIFRARSEPLVEASRGFLEGYARAAGRGVTSGRVLHARGERAGGHAAACLLARLDGKSPVEYVSDLDLPVVRDFARTALARPLGSLALVEQAAQLALASRP
jgi:5-methylthioribose kinase